ncbi:hypothetical protein ABB37_00227 [Leptomonas pyrrhocoris]|uniref:Guanine nucleotide-binding protein subunit beta-like protein n=1 Tax=Leptomonas pyrrhocoris TaxID=157538 RepID=A0A0N1J5F5_LEPPY|nr:hypothetical protein ABB37_00227 [Leptomonas pyrrhocoris]KPA85918.1 hypothetical protein ABB37_00227 [Leptomonas pyrrhocoris]|eukprot:XP_015664357.1 hypothetical protein ABB37_00227 [Leptomonas pyrrhocoris]
MSLPARTPQLEVGPSPWKLEDAPTYRDEWSRQHPALSLLYHHDVITHLVWCAVACRYLTGGEDGEVKIWKSEPSHSRSAAALFKKPSVSGAARPWLLPERHILTLNGPVTGLCVTDKDAGNSEVAVVASTDGTLTLCRTNTGEIVRTLRGARGESVESYQVPAVHARNASLLEAEAEELVGDRASCRPLEQPRCYPADAMSRRIAPMSDLAIVRRPIYAIHAYRDEVRDVFTGPSNGFFHGLNAVAPTYAHLTPHEETVADVLAAFGTLATTGPDRAAASTAVSPRQWFASSVALVVAPDTRRGPSSSTTGEAAPQSAQDVYLLLGFPEGLLQVYVLPRRWFQLHLHCETRLEPPSLRVPIVSAKAHTAAVVRIEVLPVKDLVVSVSEDGTTQLRRLTALQAPLRQLGTCVVPAPHALASSPVFSSLSPAQHPGNVGVNQGHSRRITCCCMDAAHQLLITGSADHTLCWWSLMAGSPSTPVRVLSLRDTSCNVVDAAVAAAGVGPPNVHGGFPLDVSFFHRRCCRRGGVGADEGGTGEGTSSDADKDMLLLVLDSEQFVRVFDALNAKLLLIQAETSPCGDARMRRNVRLLRYDNVNGADRLILGGLSLLPWYLSTISESNAVDGHLEPIIFAMWSAALKCVISADAHHVLLWRLGSISDCDAQNNTAASAATTPQKEDRQASVHVLRVWRIPPGIRSITLCDGDRTDKAGARLPSLLIALKEQPLLVQYDCLAENPFLASASAAAVESGQLREPLPLRQLVLRMKSDDIDGTRRNVTDLAAVSTAARHNAAHVESTTSAPTAYVCAVCPRGKVHGAHDNDRGQGSVLMYTLGDIGVDVASADGGAGDQLFPSREVRLLQRKGRPGEASTHEMADEVVSVLAVPKNRLLVLGGRRVLYVTSLLSSTSSTTPCSLLSPAPVGTRRPPKSSAAPSCATRCATAVFPGPLTYRDDGEGNAVQGKGNAVGGDAAATVDLTVDVASPTASLEGYLSRLVHIACAAEEQEGEQMEPPPCLILSGSNVGVVQLWDVQDRTELWRFHVSLSQEPITALAAQRCAAGAARWLVAVGDQTGVVTVLDLTGVIASAQGRAVVSVSAAAAPSSVPSLDVVEGAFMVDRWQAHTETVSGVCFGEAEPHTGEDQLLFTTGEDKSVVVWTLPMLPSSMFGCVQTGKRLFDQRTSYSINPSLTGLPRATRGAYAKLQQCYVRRGLFDRYPELVSAFTSLYMQPAATDGRVAGENEKEEALLDHAWNILVADAHSVLSATGSTSRLAETTVEKWCVSLLAAPPPAAPYHSTDHCSISSSLVSDSLPTASLVFAFADRCCGVDPRLKGLSQRLAAQVSRARPFSMVRESLRGAVRAVVQGSTAHRVQHLSPSTPPPLTVEKSVSKGDVNTAAASAVTRPAVELFSAVATITTLARMPALANSTALPWTGALTSISPPVPGPFSVGENAFTPGLNDVPPILPQPQRSPPAPTTRRVLFDEKGHQKRSTKEVSAADRTKSVSAPSQGYRVMFGNSAPLVRSKPVSAHSSFTNVKHDDEESPLACPAVTQHPARGHRDSSSSSAARETIVTAPRFSLSEGPTGASSGRGSGGNAAALSEAKWAGKANRKLTRESISRGVVVAKDNSDAILDEEDDSPYPAAGERRTTESIQKKSNCTQPKSFKSTNVPQPAHPIVADAYLTPALARIKTNAPQASRNERSSSLSSSQLSWYAMRQRRREVAKENARLWNTPRVMRTLLGWSGTAPTSGVVSPNCGSAAPSWWKGQRAPLPLALSDGDATAVAKRAELTKGLALPCILAPHTTNSQSLRRDGSLWALPKSNALPDLLRVSPTAAIDAAVHPGLPTRSTLRSEMAAMKATMRQSVQQRATQRRLQRATIAAEETVDDIPHATVETDVTEVVSKSALTDGLSDNAAESNDLDDDDLAEDARESPVASSETTATPVQTNELSVSKHVQARVSVMANGAVTFPSSRPLRGVANHSRVRHANSGPDARRMATVPLPNVTTRHDIFLHRGGGGKM